MNDDELRKTIADAHRDDAPPPFAAILGRARARRRPPLVLALPLVAAIALLVFWLRPHVTPAPPAATAELTIAWKDPLAFLLVPPNDDVLRTIPAFDTGEGDLQ